MKKVSITSSLFITLLIVLVFSACSKSSEKPSGGNETIDLSQYCIVGKLINAMQPYIITLTADAKAYWIYAGGDANIRYSYSFSDGTLTIKLGNNQKFMFKIKDKQIVSYEGAYKLATYSLEKIPETNQFAGNVFSGGWKNSGSSMTYFSKLKFNDTQYGEASLGDPVINKDYALINNVSAISKTGSETLSFFVILNGKLEAGRLSNNVVSSGTFTK